MATVAAWEVQGRPTARPVPTTGLSISLQVPYRDEHGQPAQQVMSAIEIAPAEGGVVATFRLTDQWARLAYGALGVAGFQAEPAKVTTRTSFPPTCRFPRATAGSTGVGRSQRSTGSSG